MAETALIGVANSVLRTLSSPALKEILLLWNSDKDFKKLKESIETITNFLHDAELRESKEHLVKGWLSRLRAVLYDADDLFDSIAYRALREKANVGNKMQKVRIFFKSNPKVFQVKTTHVVKDLRERIDDIAKDMSQFNFAIKPNEIEEFPIRLRDRKETHSFVDAVDIIGRDQDRDEIMKLLLLGDHRGQQNFSVISVIGFGGLGKTALAQLVFNDERVKGGFDLCLWVCINYFSDLNKVVMAILASILETHPHDNSLDHLQKELRKNIDGKKYLLVLDDVWDEDASNWLELKRLLNCGKSGSKVLVTTRKTNVAKCLDAVKPYYELRVLSKESAWSLFVKVTFEEGELSNDSELVPLGKEIVCKTGYVPLALIAIGSMLRCKPKDKKTWLFMVDRELSDILSDDASNDKIMQVLKVSYNDLPSALKHCFAYCSLFPKDYDFDKDQLVRLWIAQGFIVPHDKKSLEEVGDDCFFHMVDRCFFQEVEMCETFDVHYRYRCKMHDLLHDLAIQVAGSECKRIFKEYLGTTLRHISAEHYSDFKASYSGMSSHSKTLKTLLLRGDDTAKLTTEFLSSFLSSFKVLRALQLSHFEFEKLPDSIEGLIHLRYLDLSRNSKLKYLPHSICKLHNLQTLILEGCSGMKKLPSNLGKLVSLRHLILEDCGALDTLPSGLAVLTSLVTLDRLIVHPDDGGLRYMGGLDNLCGFIRVELPEKGWSNCIEEARESNLSRKHKLNGMSLHWRSGDSEDKMAKEEAKAVLEQLEPNENLQHLKIKGFRGDTLSDCFWSLSNLKKLVLHDCSLEYMDVSCVRSGRSSLFSCLEFLQMKHLRNLKGWWRELGDNADMSALPCLLHVSEVLIENCPNLMESMPSLSKEIENLKLMYVNEKLVNKLLSTTPNMSCSYRIECCHYNKLQSLILWDIKDLECLPEGWIRYLTALKSLYISNCDELSWVSSCGLTYLTSLEEFRISCFNRVRLEDRDGEKMLAVEITNGLGMMMLWKALQRLRRLEVHWQSHLLEGLQYLTSLEELEIHYYESNQVEVDNEDMEGKGLLWKLGLMEGLQSLNIRFSMIRCMFPTWIQYLRCLKELTLSNCKELMSINWGILANMNLRSLRFDWVSKVKIESISFDDCVAEQQTQFNSLDRLHISGDVDDQDEEWIRDIPWNLLPSLPNLTLYRIRELRSLPDGIQHLTSLRQLTIVECFGIERIPDWIINLTSLQLLDMRWCSPKLAKRCEKETGVDWHLISHIPHILVGDKQINGVFWEGEEEEDKTKQFKILQPLLW